MKNLQFVIVYDIADTKRRTKLSEELEGIGQRVNLSVFECTIKPEKLEQIRRDVNQLIHQKHDSVIFYPLCLHCLSGVFSMGRNPSRNLSKSLIIV